MIDLSFNGKTFTQRSDGYVNLGQLCATHGKKFHDWSRSKNAKAYLAALAENEPGIKDLIITDTDAIGGKAGTWGHPLVAIEVARWISPEFAVWCDGHIFTLLSSGNAAIAPQQPTEAEADDETIALAGLDAALGGIMDPNLLAATKKLAIEALHNKTLTLQEVTARLASSPKN